MAITMFCVALEGNIGVGKSTILYRLHEKYNIDTVTEPVQKWCKCNFLSKLKTNTLACNLLIACNRKKMLNMYSGSKMIIIERSFDVVREVFMQNVIDTIDNQAFDAVVTKPTRKIDLYIYLQSTVNLCLQ